MFSKEVPPYDFFEFTEFLKSRFFITSGLIFGTILFKSSCPISFKALNEIGHEDLKRIVPKISPEVMKNLDLRNSVNSKKSYGGTSFENIKKMIRKHKKEIK